LYSWEGRFVEDAVEDPEVPVVVAAIVVAASAQSWSLGCLSCPVVGADWGVASGAGCFGET
jgi:hypothetical protein